jgi:hypothetical protein
MSLGLLIILGAPRPEIGVIAQAQKADTARPSRNQKAAQCPRTSAGTNVTLTRSRSVQKNNV